MSEEKDGLIHVRIGSCYFAPCGARVASLEVGRFIYIQNSVNEEHLDLVTCAYCMAITARLVRAYRKAGVDDASKRAEWSVQSYTLLLRDGNVVAEFRRSRWAHRAREMFQAAEDLAADTEEEG